MIRARHIVLGFGAVAAFAAVDANYLHWSGPPLRPGVAAAEPQPVVVTDGWALPLHANVIDRRLDAPHHGYPALDIPVPSGTPIAAIHPGTVARIRNNRCGLGIKVTGDRITTTYCHASRLIAGDGTTVQAGERIALSGSTGRATGPHLHLEVYAAGDERCPSRLLAAIRYGQSVPDPSTLPTTGCID